MTFTRSGRLFTSRSILDPTPLALIAVVGAWVSLDPKPGIDGAASAIGERLDAAPIWTGACEASLPMWADRTPLQVEQTLATARRKNREIRLQLEHTDTSHADLLAPGPLLSRLIGPALRLPFDRVSGVTVIRSQVVPSFTALWHRDGRIAAAKARVNQTVLEISNNALRLVAIGFKSGMTVTTGVHP